MTVRRGIVKYNNNGDYITAWGTDMDPSWIAVADDDTIYCLFKSGVQVFAPQ